MKKLISGFLVSLFISGLVGCAREAASLDYSEGEHAAALTQMSVESAQSSELIDSRGVDPSSETNLAATSTAQPSSSGAPRETVSNPINRPGWFALLSYLKKVEPDLATLQEAQSFKDRRDKISAIIEYVKQNSAALLGSDQLAAPGKDLVNKILGS